MLYIDIIHTEDVTKPVIISLLKHSHFRLRHVDVFPVPWGFGLPNDFDSDWH